MPSPNRVWHAFGGFARSDLSTAYEHAMKILLQMVDFHDNNTSCLNENI